MFDPVVTESYAAQSILGEPQQSIEINEIIDNDSYGDCNQNQDYSSTLQIDVSQARQQLELLGYSENDPVFLRELPRKGEKGNGRNITCTIATLPTVQRPDKAIYLVVNGGGQDNKRGQIKKGRALMFESDDSNLSRDQHATLWQKLGDDKHPTFQVETRHSIHTYLVYPDPPSINDWCELQSDCNEFLDTDRKVKDAPRLMRLAGAWHTEINLETGEVLQPVQCQLINATGKQYSYQELRSIIPKRQAKKSKPVTPKPQSRPVTDFNGQKPSDYVEQAKKLLGMSLYESILVDDHGRCNCPFHDSKSGNSAWIREYPDGSGYHFNCPTCTDMGNRESINTFEFWLWQKHGPNTPIPTGKDYVNTAKEFCKLAGIEIPDKPRHQQQHNQQQSQGKDGDRLPQNKWQGLVEHNTQMGVIDHKAEPPFLIEGNDEENNQLLVDNPNLIKGCKLTEKTIPDPETGELIEVKGYPTYKFVPKANFIFHVERILQSGSTGGGYVLRIERVKNGRLTTNRITIDSNDCNQGHKLSEALNNALGLHLINTANHHDLLKTFQVKTDEYYAKGGDIYRLADRHGCQSDGTWVFENAQFKPDGTPTTESETKWVFNSRLSTGDEHIPSPKIADQDPNALPNLIKAVQDFSGDNFMLFVAAIGFGAMSAQFNQIIDQEGAFPILNIYGDRGGGKSVAAETAASLFGSNWDKDGCLSSSSQSALYERLKSIGNALTVYDDPPRDSSKGSGNVSQDELFKRLYNAKPRVVRGNCQTPHSPILVTTNHVCGDDSPATRSRLIRLHFPTLKLDESSKKAFPRLRQAQKQASGALSQIIRLGYPKAEIDRIESELLEFLPVAHLRIAKSLAQLTYYTQAVCDRAGVNVDFKQWAIAHLCPHENDADSNQDSLQDFMEKVGILQGKAVLGEWNVKTVERDGVEYTALVLPEVWAAVDREFSPPYSLSIIKALIHQHSGLQNQQRKFYPDRDITLTYERNLLINSDATPPKTRNKKCCLIPSTVTSAVTKVTSGNQGGNQNGYRYNPCGVSVSEIEPPPVTKVTKKIQLNKNEMKEEEAQPEADTFSMHSENPGNQNPVTTVTTVTTPKEPIQGKGYSGNQNGYHPGYPTVTTVTDPQPSSQNPYSVEVIAVANRLRRFTKLENQWATNLAFHCNLAKYDYDLSLEANLSRCADLSKLVAYLDDKGA